MSGAIATTAILGGIGLAGSVGGAAIASSGAKSAANTQANAADNAAQLQYQASQNALNFQEQQYNQNQQNMAPWLQYGGGALSNLGYLMGISPNMSLGYQGAQAVQHSLGGSVGGTALPSGTGGGTSGPAPAPGSPGSFGRPTAMNSPVASPVSGTQSLGSLTQGLNSGQPGVSTGSLGYTPPGASPVSGVGSINGGPAASLAGSDGIGYTAPSPGVAGLGGGFGGVSGGPVGAIGSGDGLGGAPSSSPSGGFGSLMTPYSGHFEAPTELTMQNDPGYQERLKLGTDAVQRSAAARGGVLTGGTLKDLNTYGQDYASNEYGNVYQRALQGFDTNYNQYNTDQANQFNRLAAIAGIGQTAAGQLSTAGQNASNNISSNLLGTAQSMGNAYQNAGAANASGIAGSANAWGGAVGGVGNSLSNLYMLQQLQGLGGGQQPDPSYDYFMPYGNG